MGITGGLAAPLVVAGIGTAFGASAAVALGTTAGIYAIGTLFAVSGVTLTSYHMGRRVGKLEDFFFLRLAQVEELPVTLCVSGWAMEDEAVTDYVEPWAGLDTTSDVHCLVWERAALHTLTVALSKLLKDEAVSFAITEMIKHTLLAGVLAAVAWPAAVLKAG